MNLDNASVQFIGFGLAVAVLVNLSRSATWRYGVLLVASLLFVGLLSHGLAAALPLAGFLVLGYVGIWLSRTRKSALLASSVIVITIVYMWLKKYTILPSDTFLPFVYLTTGLSYIFFRVLHLQIESGQDTDRPPVGIGEYLLYTLNFTTLVSGPIQRIEEFEITTPALDLNVVARQMQRIIIGFFKVNIVALLLHAVQQDALAQLTHPESSEARLYAAFRLAVVYPFFLYANFSGYIDIVIALARLMRLELPENFDRPFSASSFLDFWNRWHITLSRWLKTYVYFPLLATLMRRVPNPKLHPYIGVFCFFVTFFLVGIWHGRTSEFVVFGVLQGGGVAINKLWQMTLTGALGKPKYRNLTKDGLYVSLGRGLTFTWFAFTLFWFWADWNSLDLIFAALNPGGWSVVWMAVWAMATMVLAGWELLRSAVLGTRLGGVPLFTHRYMRAAYVSTMALFGFTIAVLLNQAAPDIVYKAF